jgi:site-specific DNA recombinase
VPIVRTAVRAVWERRVEINDRFAGDIGQQIKAVEKQVEQFLERIVATDNATVINAYEAKIAKLEGEKAALMDRLLEHDEIPADFESCFQTAFSFLGNPQKL